MALVSDTIFSLLLLATGLLSASTIGFAVAWVRARERAIRAEQRAGVPDATLTQDAGASRFDRLEQAVDAIAVEVEQMAEGQRFVSKLLGERPLGERPLAERAREQREVGAAPAPVPTPS